jgi:hypothetical protein
VKKFGDVSQQLLELMYPDILLCHTPPHIALAAMRRVVGDADFGQSPDPPRLTDKPRVLLAKEIKGAEADAILRVTA